MDRANIMLFVGLALCKKPVITVGEIQKFIKSRDEVAKILQSERIEEVLEDLEYVGFVYHKDYDEMRFWSRNEC